VTDYHNARRKPETNIQVVYVRMRLMVNGVIK